MGLLSPLHLVLFLVVAISAEQLSPSVFPSLKDTVDGIKNTPKVKYIESATLTRKGEVYVYEIKYKALEGTECKITIDVQKDGSSSDVYTCTGKVDDLSPLLTWDNDASQGVLITDKEESRLLKEKIELKTHVPRIAQLIEIHLVPDQRSKHYFVKYISRLGTLCRLTLILNEDGGGSEKVMCTDTKEKDNQENSEMDENEQTDWRRITREEKPALIHDLEKLSGSPVGDTYIDGFVQFRSDNSTATYIIWYYDSKRRRCTFKQQKLASGAKNSKLDCQPFEFPDLISEDKDLIPTKGEEKLQALVRKLKGAPTVDAVITSKKESHPGGNLYRGVYRATNGDVCTIVILTDLQLLNPREMHRCAKSDENSETPRTFPGDDSDEGEMSEEEDVREDRIEPELGVKAEVTAQDQKIIASTIKQVGTIPKHYKVESVDKRVTVDKQIYTVILSYTDGQKCVVHLTFKSDGDFEEGTHDCNPSEGQGDAHESKEDASLELGEPVDARLTDIGEEPVEDKVMDIGKKPADDRVTDIGEEPVDGSASDEAQDPPSGDNKIGDKEMRVFLDTMENSVEAPEIGRILGGRRKVLQHFTYYHVRYISKDGQTCSVRLRIFGNGLVKPTVKCQRPEGETVSIDENAVDSETELRPEDERKIRKLILEMNWERILGIISGSKLVTGNKVFYKLKYKSNGGKVCFVEMTLDMGGYILQKRHKCSIENGESKPTEELKADLLAENPLKTKDIKVIQIYANKKLKWNNKVLEITEGTKKIDKEGMLYRFHYNSVENKECVAQIIIRYDGSSGEPTYNRCESNIDEPVEGLSQSSESEEKPQKNQRRRRRRLRVHAPKEDDDVILEAEDVITRRPNERQSFEVINSREWDTATEDAPDQNWQDTFRTPSKRDDRPLLEYPPYPEVTGDDLSVRKVKLTPEGFSGFEKIMGRFRKAPKISKTVEGTMKNTRTKKIYWVRYESSKSRHPLYCSIIVIYDKTDGSLFEQHVCNKLSEKPQYPEESDSDEIETLIKTMAPPEHPVTIREETTINTLQPGKKLSAEKIRKITALILLFKNTPRPKQISGYSKVKISGNVVFTLDYLAQDGQRCDMKITKYKDGSLFENHQCSPTRPDVSIEEESQPLKRSNEEAAISMEQEAGAVRPILPGRPNGDIDGKEILGISKSSQANRTQDNGKNKLIAFIEKFPGVSKIVRLFKNKPYSTSAATPLLQNNESKEKNIISITEGYQDNQEKRPQSDNKIYRHTSEVEGVQDSPTTEIGTGAAGFIEGTDSIPTSESPEGKSGHDRNNLITITKSTNYDSRKKPVVNPSKLIGATGISPTRPKSGLIDEMKQILSITDTVPGHPKKKVESDKERPTDMVNIISVSPKTKGQLDEKKLITIEDSRYQSVPMKKTASFGEADNDKQELFGTIGIIPGRPKDEEDLIATTESVSKQKGKTDENKHITIADSSTAGPTSKPDRHKDKLEEAMDIVRISPKTKGKTDKKKFITVAESTPGTSKIKAENFDKGYNDDKELIGAEGYIPGKPKNVENGKQKLSDTTQKSPGRSKKMTEFDKEMTAITNSSPSSLKKRGENFQDQLIGAAAIIPARPENNERDKKKLIAIEDSVPGSSKKQVIDIDENQLIGITTRDPKEEAETKMNEVIEITTSNPNSSAKPDQKNIIEVTENISGSPKKKQGSNKDKLIAATAITPGSPKRIKTEKKQLHPITVSIPGGAKKPMGSLPESSKDEELFAANIIKPRSTEKLKTKKETVIPITYSIPGNTKNSEGDEELMTTTTDNGRPEDTESGQQKLIAMADIVLGSSKKGETKEKIIALTGSTPGNTKEAPRTDHKTLLEVTGRIPEGPKNDKEAPWKAMKITTANPKKEGVIDKKRHPSSISPSVPNSSGETSIERYDLVEEMAGTPRSQKKTSGSNKKKLIEAINIFSRPEERTETSKEIAGSDKMKFTFPVSPNNTDAVGKLKYLLASFLINPKENIESIKNILISLKDSIPGHPKKAKTVEELISTASDYGSPKKTETVEQKLIAMADIVPGSPKKAETDEEMITVTESTPGSPKRVPKTDHKPLFLVTDRFPDEPENAMTGKQTPWEAIESTTANPEKKGVTDKKRHAGIRPSVLSSLEKTNTEKDELSEEMVSAPRSPKKRLRSGNDKVTEAMIILGKTTNSTEATMKKNGGSDKMEFTLPTSFSNPDTAEKLKFLLANFLIDPKKNMESVRNILIALKDIVPGNPNSVGTDEKLLAITTDIRRPNNTESDKHEVIAMDDSGPDSPNKAKIDEKIISLRGSISANTKEAPKRDHKTILEVAGTAPDGPKNSKNDKQPLWQAMEVATANPKNKDVIETKRRPNIKVSVPYRPEIAKAQEYELTEEVVSTPHSPKKMSGSDKKKLIEAINILNKPENSTESMSKKTAGSDEMEFTFPVSPNNTDVTQKLEYLLASLLTDPKENIESIKNILTALKDSISDHPKNPKTVKKLIATETDQGSPKNKGTAKVRLIAMADSVPGSPKKDDIDDIEKVITSGSTPGKTKKIPKLDHKTIVEVTGTIADGPKNTKTGKEVRGGAMEITTSSPKKKAVTENKRRRTIRLSVPYRPEMAETEEYEHTEDVGSKPRSPKKMLHSDKNKLIEAINILSKPGDNTDSKSKKTAGSDKIKFTFPVSPNNTDAADKFKSELVSFPIDSKKNIENIKDSKNILRPMKDSISGQPKKVKTVEELMATATDHGTPKYTGSGKQTLIGMDDSGPDGTKKAETDEKIITITGSTPGNTKEVPKHDHKSLLEVTGRITDAPKNVKTDKQTLWEAIEIATANPKKNEVSETKRRVPYRPETAKTEEYERTEEVASMLHSQKKTSGSNKKKLIEAINIFNKPEERIESTSKKNDGSDKMEFTFPVSPNNTDAAEKLEIQLASFPIDPKENIESIKNTLIPLKDNIPGHPKKAKTVEELISSASDHGSQKKTEIGKQKLILLTDSVPGSPKKAGGEIITVSGSTPGNTKKAPKQDLKTLLEVVEPDEPKNAMTDEPKPWEAMEITTAKPDRKGVTGKKRHTGIRPSVPSKSEKTNTERSELSEEMVSTPLSTKKMVGSGKDKVSEATNIPGKTDYSTETTIKKDDESDTMEFTLPISLNNTDTTDKLKYLLASFLTDPKKNRESIKNILVALKYGIPDQPQGPATTERMEVLTTTPSTSLRQDSENYEKKLIKIIESIPGIPKIKEILMHIKMKKGENQKHRLKIQGEDSTECNIRLQISKDYELVRQKHACKAMGNDPLYDENSVTPNVDQYGHIPLSQDETNELKKRLRKVAPIYKVLTATSKEKNSKKIYHLKILSLEGQLCNVWAVGDLTGHLLTNATVCHKVWKDDPPPVEDEKEENFGPREGPGKRGIITKELFEVVGKIIYEVLHMPRISEIVHSSVMIYRTRAHGIFEYKSEDRQVCKIVMLLNLANEVLDERHKCLPEDYGEHITNEDLYEAADDRDEIEMNGKDKKELINFAATFSSRKFPEIENITKGLTTKSKYTTVYDVKYRTKDGSRCSLKLTIYKRDNSTSYNYECLADLPKFPKYNSKGQLLPPLGERKPLDRKSRLTLLEKLLKLPENNDITQISDGFLVRGMNSTDAYFAKYNTAKGKVCRAWLLVSKDGEKSKLQCTPSNDGETCGNHRPSEEKPGYRQTLSGVDERIILKNMEDPLQPVKIQEGYLVVDGPTKTYHVQFNTKSGAFCKLRLEVGEEETSKLLDCTYKTHKLPTNPKFDVAPLKNMDSDDSIEVEESNAIYGKLANNATTSSEWRRRHKKEKPNQNKYEGEDISLASMEAEDIEDEPLHDKNKTEEVKTGKEELIQEDILYIQGIIPKMKNAPEMLSITGGFKEKNGSTTYYRVEYSTTNGTCTLDMTVHEDGSAQRKINCTVAVDPNKTSAKLEDASLKKPTRKMNETDKKYILEKMSGYTNMPPIKLILGGTVERGKGFTLYLVEYSATNGNCTLNMTVNDDGSSQRQVNCTVTEDPNKVTREQKDGSGKTPKSRKVNAEDEKYITEQLSGLKNVPPLKKIIKGIVEEQKGAKHYHVEYSTINGTCTVHIVVHVDGSSEHTINCTVTKPSNKVSRGQENDSWGKPLPLKLNTEDGQHILETLRKLKDAPPVKRIIKGTVEENKKGAKRYHVEYSTTNGTCTLKMTMDDDGSAEHRLNCILTKDPSKVTTEEKNDLQEEPGTRKITQDDEEYIIGMTSGLQNMPSLQKIISGTVETKKGAKQYHIEYSTKNGTCTLNMLVNEDGSAEHRVNCTITKDVLSHSEDDSWKKLVTRKINEADQKYILEKMSGQTNMPPIKAIIGGTVEREKGMTHYHVEYSTTNGNCTLNMIVKVDGSGEHRVNCTVTKDTNKESGGPAQEDGREKPVFRRINEADEKYILEKMRGRTSIPPIKEIIGGTFERGNGITHYHVEYTTTNGNCTLNMIVKVDGSGEHQVNCTVTKDPKKESEELSQGNGREKPVFRRINGADEKYILEKMRGRTNVPPVKAIIGGTLERRKGIKHYHVEYSTTNGNCTLNMIVKDDGSGEHRVNCTVTKDTKKESEELAQGDGREKPVFRRINEADEKYILEKMRGLTNVPPVKAIIGGTLEKRKGNKHYHVEYSTTNGNCTLNMIVKDDGSGEHRVNCTVTKDTNKESGGPAQGDGWEKPVFRRINGADEKYILEKMRGPTSIPPIKAITGGTLETGKGMTHYHVEYSTTNGNCTLNIIVNDDGSGEHRVNCTVTKGPKEISGEQKDDIREKPVLREINQADKEFILNKMRGTINTPSITGIIGGTVEIGKGMTRYHVEYSATNGNCTLNMTVKDDGSAVHRVNCTVTEDPKETLEKQKVDSWGKPVSREINQTDEDYILEKMNGLTNMPPITAIIGGTVEREKGMTHYVVQYLTTTGTCTLKMIVNYDGSVERRVNCTVTKDPKNLSGEQKHDSWEEPVSREMNQADKEYILEKMSGRTKLPPIKAIIGGTVKRDKGMRHYHVEYSTTNGNCTLNMIVNYDGSSESRVNCTVTKDPKEISGEPKAEQKDDSWGKPAVSRKINESDEKFILEKTRGRTNMPPIKAITGGTVEQEKGITHYKVDYSTTTGTCTLNMIVLSDGRTENRVNCTVTREPNKPSIKSEDKSEEKQETRKLNEDDKKYIMKKLRGIKNLPIIIEVIGGTVKRKNGAQHYHIKYLTTTGTCSLEMIVNDDGSARHQVSCTVRGDPSKEIPLEKDDDSREVRATRQINEDDKIIIIENMNGLRNMPPIKAITGGIVETTQESIVYKARWRSKYGQNCRLKLEIFRHGKARRRAKCIDPLDDNPYWEKGSI